MNKNVIFQLQRRSLTGSRIRNFTVTCDKCPRIDYVREYALQCCEHIWWKHDGFEKIMWDLPYLRHDGRDRYDPASKEWYYSTYYIIKNERSSHYD